MCDQLAWSIGREYRAAALHGDKRQQERDFVLAAFKDGRQPVLVATDVAARGLDVKDVAAVINYDMPPGVEDYVHRIGMLGSRTGSMCIVTGPSQCYLVSTLHTSVANLLPPVYRSHGPRRGYRPRLHARHR